MTNRQRISFDRVIRTWRGIYEDCICPKCLKSMVIEPHHAGDESCYTSDYLLYICKKCNGEYHISCEDLKSLKGLATNAPSRDSAPPVPVEREYECHFNAEDDK